jgi:hypothetical protein
MAVRMCWALGNTLVGPADSSKLNSRYGPVVDGDAGRWGRFTDPGEGFEDGITAIMSVEDSQRLTQTWQAAQRLDVLTFFDNWVYFSNPANLLDLKYSWHRRWVQTACHGVNDPTGASVPVTWRDDPPLMHPCKRRDVFQPHTPELCYGYMLQGPTGSARRLQQASCTSECTPRVGCGFGVQQALRCASAAVPVFHMWGNSCMGKCMQLQIAAYCGQLLVWAPVAHVRTRYVSSARLDQAASCTCVFELGAK